MKKRNKIILIVLIVLLLLFLGMSYFIGTQVFMGSTQLVTCEDTSKVKDTFWEKYNVDYDVFCNTYSVEKIEITSTFDGHIIPADYIYALGKEGNKDNSTVILVHGLGGNRYTNYPLAEMFLQKGYNVLTYDQRSSNENTAQYTTFGYWEKYDLIDYIDYVYAYASEKVIGIWGTSFGGATAGLAMGEKDVERKVDFMILDCPVSDMKWMVEEEMRKMDIGLPIPYMTFCGNIINKIELGFGYEDANVCDAIIDIQIPVLVINSEADTLTPQFMGQDIYDAIHNDAIKMIWTVDDSEHTEMWLDYNQEYREKVEILLNSLK
uniref:alpha/beta hydrolase n=1 Tax=Acetatifactor sp. TaxID=1872090 RepID=UPI0040568FCF